MSNAESNLANDPSLAPSASVMSGTLSDKVKNWRWFSENLAELLPQVVASAGAGVATGGTSPALRRCLRCRGRVARGWPSFYTESINRGSSPEVAKAEAALIGWATLPSKRSLARSCFCGPRVSQNVLQARPKQNRRSADEHGRGRGWRGCHRAWPRVPVRHGSLRDGERPIGVP